MTRKHGRLTARIIGAILISGLFVCFASITEAHAQGICTVDTLTVSKIAGRVELRIPKGIEPIAEAAVVLRRGDHLGAVIRKTNTDVNGRFRITGLRAGRYSLKVSPKHFRVFELDLIVSKVKTQAKDLIIVIGVDFGSPCSGSYALLED